MPIDASIYQNLKPVEMPSMMDTAGKAMNLSSLAMQQQHLGKQMEQEDRESKMTAHLQKASVFGNALESLAGMPEQERAVAYPKAKAELVSAGVLKPEDAPDEYDSGFYRQSLMRFRQSKEGIEHQLKIAQIGEIQAKTAKDYAEARANASAGKTLTPGQKMADDTFAKDAAEYYYGGGKATTEKNLARFASAIQTLRDNPDLTGGITPRIPILSSDSVQDTINPKMAAVRDEVRGAVQASLRQVLGAQFTEKEGEAIFNRSFNPRLSTEENVKRATAELEAIQRMAAQKDGSMEHFLANGTLRGYRPSGTDLAAKSQPAAGTSGKIVGFGTDANAGTPPAPKRKVSADEVSQYAMKHNMKASDARDYLRGQGYDAN